MMDACQRHSAGGITVYAGVDEDDPYIWEYHRIKPTFGHLKIFVDGRKSLSAWTNKLAEHAVEDFGTKNTFLVSMGDDHLVHTNFWDIKLRNAIKFLDGPGFSFGDDMMNGSGLCTCWMVSAKVVESVGWMMLPNCNHMYVDNAIMELGEATNRIKYVPRVMIEHLHPSIKKSETDATYLDSEINYVPDLGKFRDWRNSPDFAKAVTAIEDLKW